METGASPKTGYSRTGPGGKDSEESSVERRIRIISRLLLIFSVLFPLAGLIPELVHLVPDTNDGAFHMGLLQNTLSAIKEGRNPLDFWIPSWLCGFPIFHYYQPGPYLLTAGLYMIFKGLVSKLFLFRLVTILALILTPPAHYIAMRLAGQDRAAAAGAAFLCLMISSQSYGMELSSFTWSGWGLFGQALALPFLPLALAAGWTAVQGRRKTFGPALLLFGTFMMHILYGYIAVLSLAIAPLISLKLRNILKRYCNLGRFYLQTLLLLSFFVIPLALNIPYHAKSLYDPAQKFNSVGAQKALTKLFSGSLFDLQRFPIITILVAVGLYLCVDAWLSRRKNFRGWIACGFIVWIGLYFGRATWGGLMDLLPLSKGLHMERLSNGAQMFGIWLAACGFGYILKRCCSLKKPFLWIPALAAMLVFHSPVIHNRYEYYKLNARITAKNAQLFSKEMKTFAPVLKRLLQAPPGRVYCGHSGNWGGKYRLADVKVYHILSSYEIPNIGNMPFSWALTTDFQSHLSTRYPQHYELFNIRYLLTNEERVVPPNGELILKSGEHFLYRIPEKGGPFSIVSVPFTIIGDKETAWYMNMSWMLSGWSRNKTHAGLVFRDEDTGGYPLLRMLDQFRYTKEDTDRVHHVFDRPLLFKKDPPKEPEGSLSNQRSDRHEASVDVRLEEPAVILFKNTFHPQRHAYVDGNPTSTMMLTPGLTGVRLEAGTHQLIMRYEPGLLKPVLLIAGFILAWLINFILPTAGNGNLNHE